MFYLFLEDYKANVYNVDNRKLKSWHPWEILCFISLLALSIAWAIVSIVNINSVLSVILLFSLISVIVVIYILEKIRRKREIHTIIKKYKNEKLESFTKLLKDPKYVIVGNKTLNCIEGIEWLLKTCSTELERNKSKPSPFLSVKNFSTTLALPIITYIGGTISSTFSINEKITSAIMILTIVLMLFAIYYMVSPVLNDLLNSEKHIIEDLKDNLEYYKLVVLVSDKQYNSI